MLSTYTLEKLFKAQSADVDLTQGFFAESWSANKAILEWLRTLPDKAVMDE